MAPSGSDTAAGTETAPFRTIGKALSKTFGGETVLVAPGQYPTFTDTRARTSFVTVKRHDPAGTGLEAIQEGAKFAGGRYVRFSDMRFTGQLFIAPHPTDGIKQVASHIEVRDSHFEPVVPYTVVCAIVRGGVHDIVFERNRFFLCDSGIGGPNYTLRDPAGADISHDIVIRDNEIHRVRSDGLQFAHWRNVTIEGNSIRYQQDPLKQAHTDAIQVMGNVHDFRIANNVLSDGGQLLFIQGAYGYNSNAEIVDNVIYNSSDRGIKISETSGVKVVHNTVWRTAQYMTILLRNGVTGAEVANNIAHGISFAEGAQATYEDHNLVERWAPDHGPNDILGKDPQFVNEEAGDFRLQPSSPARGAGTSAYPAPGTADPPDIGAVLG